MNLETALLLPGHGSVLLGNCRKQRRPKKKLVEWGNVYEEEGHSELGE